MCRWLIYLLMIGFASTISGQGVFVDSIFNPKTFNNSYVSDSEGYLDSNTIDQLNYLCNDVDTLLNAQIAIVVLKNIGQDDVLELATEIGNTWGVGKNDRGIVLLVAIQNRSMAIATGEGIEPQLTDWKTSKIRENRITPQFKLNLYGAGLIEGVKEIKAEIINSIDLAIRIKDENAIHKQETQTKITQLSRVRIALLFVVGFILFFVIIKYVKWFYKWTFYPTLLISILAGGTFTLFHFGFLPSQEIRDLDNSIGLLVILSLFLFGMSFFKIYLKNLIWESIPVGLLYLFAITVVWHFLYVDDVEVEFWFPAPFTSLWFSQPKVIGYLTMSILSLLFLYVMIRVYSNSDPYVRYHRLIKAPIFSLKLLHILFPFPFFTLHLYKERYKMIFRHQKRYSLSTGLIMKRATNAQEDQYLNDLQEAEEKASSVDYDVWFSEHEGDVLVLQYEVKSYNRGKCKGCGEKTIKGILSKIIKQATLKESGEMEVIVKCYNCDFKELVKRRIPRKVSSYNFESNSISSGSSYTHSSGSSGYSSSSRSSSSSSSSGGSWGGGSFGGGGSKGSW